MFPFKAIRQAGPVALAGVTFLIYAAIAVPLGYYLHTSAMTASGLDTLEDGIFFFIGGMASWWMLRRRHHWIHCTMRNSLELFSIALGLLAYWLGILATPSTNSDLSQAIWSVALGIVGILLNWYWWYKVHPSSGQLGFRWNLLANVIGAFVLIPGGLVAYYRNWPPANYWAAIVGLILTGVFCVMPCIYLVRAVAHKSKNHPAAISAD